MMFEEKTQCHLRRCQCFVSVVCNHENKVNVARPNVMMHVFPTEKNDFLNARFLGKRLSFWNSVNQESQYTKGTSFQS